MDWEGIIIALVCCLLQHTRDVLALQCYCCDSESSNTFCVGDHMIRDCEAGMDTCQTIVHYSEATESMTIIKTCTRNSSCYQTKEEHRDIPCDNTNSRWLCIHCCHDNACNLNNAHSLEKQSFAVFLYSFVLFCFVN